MWLDNLDYENGGGGGGPHMPWPSWYASKRAIMSSMSFCWRWAASWRANINVWNVVWRAISARVMAICSCCQQSQPKCKWGTLWSSNLTTIEHDMLSKFKNKSTTEHALEYSHTSSTQQLHEVDHDQHATINPTNATISTKTARLPQLWAYTPSVW